MKIKKINELTDDHVSEVIKIFFETSSVKSFNSNKDKELFLYRYFGFYQENFSEYFYVALHGDASDVVMGYVCGAPYTFNDKALLKLQSQLEFFENEGDIYPAHLHVNVSPLFQGMRVGSTLIKSFEAALESTGVSGVHIITAPNADNRVFYNKLGFDFEVIKKLNKVDLLFMGKKIDTSS